MAVYGLQFLLNRTGIEVELGFAAGREINRQLIAAGSVVTLRASVEMNLLVIRSRIPLIRIHGEANLDAILRCYKFGSCGPIPVNDDEGGSRLFLNFAEMLGILRTGTAACGVCIFRIGCSFGQRNGTEGQRNQQQKGKSYDELFFHFEHIFTLLESNIISDYRDKVRRTAVNLTAM